MVWGFSCTFNGLMEVITNHMTINATSSHGRIVEMEREDCSMYGDNAVAY